MAINKTTQTVDRLPERVNPDDLSDGFIEVGQMVYALHSSDIAYVDGQTGNVYIKNNHEAYDLWQADTELKRNDREDWRSKYASNKKSQSWQKFSETDQSSKLEVENLKVILSDLSKKEDWAHTAAFQSLLNYLTTGQIFDLFNGNYLVGEWQESIKDEYGQRLKDPKDSVTANDIPLLLKILENNGVGRGLVAEKLVSVITTSSDQMTDSWLLQIIQNQNEDVEPAKIKAEDAILARHKNSFSECWNLVSNTNLPEGFRKKIGKQLLDQVNQNPIVRESVLIVMAQSPYLTEQTRSDAVNALLAIYGTDVAKLAALAGNPQIALMNQVSILEEIIMPLIKNDDGKLWQVASSSYPDVVRIAAGNRLVQKTDNVDLLLAIAKTKAFHEDVRTKAGNSALEKLNEKNDTESLLGMAKNKDLQEKVRIRAGRSAVSTLQYDYSNAAKTIDNEYKLFAIIQDGNFDDDVRDYAIVMLIDLIISKSNGISGSNNDLDLLKQIVTDSKITPECRQQSADAIIRLNRGAETGWVLRQNTLSSEYRKKICLDYLSNEQNPDMDTLKYIVAHADIFDDLTSSEPSNCRKQAVDKLKKADAAVGNYFLNQYF